MRVNFAIWDMIADLDGLMHMKAWVRPYLFDRVYPDKEAGEATIKTIGRKGLWGRNLLCSKLDIDVDKNGTELAGYVTYGASGGRIPPKTERGLWRDTLRKLHSRSR